jgi:hypothetical protein
LPGAPCLAYGQALLHLDLDAPVLRLALAIGRRHQRL